MRLGFIGPARGDIDTFRALAELLLFDIGVSRVVYLGADDAVEKAGAGWPEKIGAPPSDDAFYTEASLLALDAPAEAIEALVERDARLQKLTALAALPPPPARAVEMIGDRVLLLTYDKSVLDEEDVVNATGIVWGNSRDPQLRAIGQRAFMAPGWVTCPTGAHVATIENDGETFTFSLHDKGGVVVQESSIVLARAGKMGVQ